MQVAIGRYDSLREAQRAVRSLEQQQLSIQDMIVVDERQRAWRRVSRWYDKRSGKEPLAFLVVMTGAADDVQRAGRFLAGAYAPLPSAA